MRGINFILTAAFGASLLLGVSSFLGGMAPPAPQEKRGVSERIPGPRDRKAAGKGAPAAFRRIRLAQAAAVPEPAANAPAKDAAIPASQKPFDTAVTSSPSEAQQQEMVRVAATAMQIPAPSLAQVPALAKSASARALFSAAKEPANLATRSIGFYAKGCLAGAKPLPVNGPAWQAMRLSRNRMWGHPSLVKYIERFAEDAKEKDGWPGLLVGDMSMPRGGPMPYGHASHQVGLDVDIWYRPMPDRELTNEERENIPMESFLLDPGHVNPAVWTPDFTKLLRRAVSYPEVARVFVNPAIKKWLCDNVKGDRAFLRKITPIMGHDDHFHVRLVCPADNPGCQNQAALAVDEGCGKKLDTWIANLSKPAPAAPTVPGTQAAAKPVAKSAKPGAAPAKAGSGKPGSGKPLITMAQLPSECEAVLKAPPLAASQ